MCHVCTFPSPPPGPLPERGWFIRTPPCPKHMGLTLLLDGAWSSTSPWGSYTGGIMRRRKVWSRWIRDTAHWPRVRRLSDILAGCIVLSQETCGLIKRFCATAYIHWDIRNLSPQFRKSNHDILTASLMWREMSLKTQNSLDWEHSYSFVFPEARIGCEIWCRFISESVFRVCERVYSGGALYSST